MIMRTRLFLLLAWTAWWFSANAAGERYDILVAQDGSGDFTSVQEAILSVRAEMQTRKTIYIKNGVYREKVVVPTWAMNVTLKGESRDGVIIRWSDHANMPWAETGKKMGTFRTYTLLVQGHGFTAENLTIENDAPELGQAVALHVEGDRASFINCRIIGNQDTIYAGSEKSRQYYENCYIEGTTDYVFGAATAWFEGCTLHCKKNSYITAPSTPQYKEYGFFFHRCRVESNAEITKVYLGRPWRPYGMSVWIDCELNGCVRPEGWDNWRNPDNEKTARFAEYGSRGEGAQSNKRVTWAETASLKKARKYSIERVLGAGDHWNPSVRKQK